MQNTNHKVKKKKNYNYKEKRANENKIQIIIIIIQHKRNVALNSWHQTYILQSEFIDGWMRVLSHFLTSNLKTYPRNSDCY